MVFVGIAPQPDTSGPEGTQPQPSNAASSRDGAMAQKNPGSLGGSFAVSLANSVGIYTKPQRFSAKSHKLGAKAKSPKQPEDPNRPPSRQARTATPTFTERERAVIANLDQLSEVELKELNDRLYQSRIAKLQDLRRAQQDKAALQVELQETLGALADSRQAAQNAHKAVQTDKKFVATILRKYRTLVHKFESQKAQADLSDYSEIESLRGSLLELHRQMDQAKQLARVLDELEKTNADAGQLSNLLQYHKIDLAIVQAGSRQALSKAKAHKDSLFQALLALEQHLLSAKQQREDRLQELSTKRRQHAEMTADVASEEEALLQREVAWLGEQINSAKEAKDGYGGIGHSPSQSNVGSVTSPSAKPKVPNDGQQSKAKGVVKERNDIEVHLLKQQIDELEKEISEIKGEAVLSPRGFGDAGSRKMRPQTAGADGLDRFRTADDRAAKLEESLALLRVTLHKLENAVDEDGIPSAEEKASLMKQIEDLESEINLHGSTAAKIEAEKVEISKDLDWLEGLLDEAEKGKAVDEGNEKELQRLIDKGEASNEAKKLAQKFFESRQKLNSALNVADTARKDLAEQLHAAKPEESEGFDEKFQEIDEKLQSALKEAMEQTTESLRSQTLLTQKLAAAEGSVASKQLEIEQLKEQIGSGGGVTDHKENAVLRRENHSLEMEIKKMTEDNNLVKNSLRRLQQQLRVKNQEEVRSDDIPEPDDKLSAEHALRKRLKTEQPEGHDHSDGLIVTQADIAELALIWGLRPTEEPYLLWIPEKALESALPPGWKECNDRTGDAFYYELASEFSTYNHPNDTIYQEMCLQIQRQMSKKAVDAKVTDEVLEIERLRLREASAAIERQAKVLREQDMELQKEKLRSSLSIEQQDESKVKEWEARKEETLRRELAIVREEEALRSQQARDKLLTELRDELYKTERKKIREELLAEERQRISVERLKLRQKILKEETASIRKRLEEEEEKHSQELRSRIRADLQAKLESEEQERLEAEIKASEPQKTLEEQHEEAVQLQLQAARNKQQTMDEQHKLEVREYAEYLGMNPETDVHLLWIAEMALTAPLPTGWGEHQDSNGNIFFHNRATGASTYEHPMDASFKAYYHKIKNSQRS